ncbi:hypothetical protein [Burkholderia sp. TSV86]|uniref:hypothetical protein n=1 Tax=Burkholderia sp. TSV86 TaxID=1385594 RepID=UPI0012E36230|nr:hypothetical protein [Burkholderia sp. TSV86]
MKMQTSHWNTGSGMRFNATTNFLNISTVCYNGASSMMPSNVTLPVGAASISSK